MPDIIADPPDPSCYSPVPGTRIEESQSLDPDLFPSRARDVRGRFATGHSGNPRGRPRGIPNPRRRIPDLRARPLSPDALSALIDRKPWLLRPLAVQVLPPPLSAVEPAERLGINLASVKTADDLLRVLRTVWAAISRGEIGAAEAARVARRISRRLRRLARQAEAQKTAPAPPPIG
jgi:hypothetical protein